MSKAIELKPPTPLPKPDDSAFKVFLAGSIDMGNAAYWRGTLVKHFDENDDIVFLNPRRDDWDSTWEQTIENQNFREQVEWELDGLDMADLIVMYLQPETISPVSLLELGAHLNSGRVVVLCPEGYFRKGNVDITCKRYGVPTVADFDELKQFIEAKFRARRRSGHGVALASAVAITVGLVAGFHFSRKS